MITRKHEAFCLLVTAILLITLSCNRKKANQSAASLASIETQYGIRFPTNSSDQHVTSWGYNSHTLETLARFAVSEGDFEKWRSLLTNRLDEIEEFGAEYDARLVKKANWWDPHKWSASNVTLFAKDAPATGASHGKIYIFAARGGTNRIVYVHSRQVMR